MGITSLNRTLFFKYSLCLAGCGIDGSYSSTPTMSNIVLSANMISNNSVRFNRKMLLKISYKWCSPSTFSKSSHTWNRSSSCLMYPSDSMARENFSLRIGVSKTCVNISEISSSLLSSHGGNSMGEAAAGISSNLSSSVSIMSCVTSTHGSLPCIYDEVNKVKLSNMHTMYRTLTFSYTCTFNWHVNVYIKNRPGCLFIRTFFTEEFIYPLTYNAWNCMHPPFNKFDMWDQDTRPDFMEISSYPCNWICIYNKRH